MRIFFSSVISIINLGTEIGNGTWCSMIHLSFRRSDSFNAFYLHTYNSIHNQKKRNCRACRATKNWQKRNMDPNEDRPVRKIWSKSEKEMLLQILKTEGHKNLNRIAAAMPNKSMGAIKALINKYIVQAKAFKPDTSDPLDFWLHSYFSPENENLVPKALLFIRLFEDHPTPEKLNGVDMKSIYEFLHRSTLGHGPGEIPSETWKVIENEVTVISDNITTGSEREVLTYLSTLPTRQKPARDYSRKNGDKTC